MMKVIMVIMMLMLLKIVMMKTTLKRKKINLKLKLSPIAAVYLQRGRYNEKQIVLSSYLWSYGPKPWFQVAPPPRMTWKRLEVLQKRKVEIKNKIEANRGSNFQWRRIIEQGMNDDWFLQYFHNNTSKILLKLWTREKSKVIWKPDDFSAEFLIKSTIWRWL